MGSKPITQKAGTKYGSPANQEKSAAKYATMTPVKLIDPDPTKPPKSVEEDVKNEQGYLERGAVNFSLGPSQTIITPGETKYGWKGPLDTSGNYYEKLAKEEGFKNFQGTIKEYEQSKLKKMAGSGDSNVTQEQGESTTTTQPGELLTRYAYEPQVREADTFTIRQSRKQDRDVRATKRRLDRAIKKGSQAEITALQAKYDRKLKEQTEGVNPYNTRRSKENIKAPEGTQTKSEFESRFGGNNMGIQEIKSFTPGDITFSTPTMPSSNRTASDFTGSGSYLNRGARVTNEQQLQNFFNLHDSAVSGNEGNLWNPKGMPKKGNVNRGYKMGGYGTKNK
jgi:hypothetical protein